MIRDFLAEPVRFPLSIQMQVDRCGKHCNITLNYFHGCKQICDPDTTFPNATTTQLSILNVYYIKAYINTSIAQSGTTHLLDYVPLLYLVTADNLFINFCSLFSMYFKFAKCKFNN